MRTDLIWALSALNGLEENIRIAENAVLQNYFAKEMDNRRKRLPEITQNILQ